MAEDHVAPRPRPRPSTAARRPVQWWLDRSVRFKGLTVIAVPIFALFAVTGAGLGLQLQERAERRIAIRANELSSAARTVFTDVADAETAVRGFAGTHEDAFLQPYTQALTRIDGDLAALRKAAAAEGHRQAADAIIDTVRDEFTLIARLRAAVLTGASGPSLVTTLKDGKIVMDQLRLQIADLADKPSRLVQQKRQSITRLEVTLQRVQILGLVLGALAGLVGVALFTSGISRRVRLAADNASRLGTADQLLPSIGSADELGQLGDSLVQAHRLLDARLAQLSAARDHAVQATQSKNTFLSRTSHELRTPLNAILGFAQLLEMADLDEEDTDSARRIISAGKHLLALINELIDIACIEAGELRLSIEPVQVRTLVDEVVALIGPLAAARAITVRSPPTDPTWAALADHQRLRQVAVNLASNAVKYNHHGGLITIACHLDGPDRIALTVTDTGPGLTDAEIDQIFLPFERLAADQHGIEGTGIGLPLARALTDAMRGTLDVTSAPGHGSTFTVRLPRAADLDLDPSVPPDPHRAGPADGSPVDPIAVLSIEDNIANNAMLSRLFHGWDGATLYTANSGSVGLALAGQHRPDLILLDLHLPDLSGEQVLARLRSEPNTAGIPIAVLSADATPDTIHRLRQHGVLAYLAKPLDLAELRGVLAAASAHRSAQQEPHGQQGRQPVRRVVPFS